MSQFLTPHKAHTRCIILKNATQKTFTFPCRRSFGILICLRCRALEPHRPAHPGPFARHRAVSRPARRTAESRCAIRPDSMRRGALWRDGTAPSRCPDRA